jgi:UDPglucose 6-dehydrogenase
LCEQTGADVSAVAKVMGLDGRIGPKFLHPGLGFGGSCLPKDTRAIVNMGKEHEEELSIISAAIEVNAHRVPRAVHKLEALLGKIEGKRIALLGLAFKPNTDDVREAPAIELVRILRQKGASVVGFDPEANQSFRRVVADMETTNDAYSCAKGADAVVLVTEWNSFRTLDLLRLKSSMRSAVFLDCRNVYERAHMESLGFAYGCFGR